MQRSDVVIIGGGIFGLATAWYCVKRSMSVEVHEADRIGDGASGGLIGALSPHMPEKWNDKKAFQLRCLISAEPFWREVSRRAEMDTGYGRIGRIMPIKTEAGRALAKERGTQSAELWREQANWSVIDHCNGLAPSAHGYVHETLSGRLYPKAAMAALAQALRSMGVKIHENSRVASSDINAQHVVVTSGYECGVLLPNLPKGFIKGVKGQSALLEANLPEHPIIFDDGTYIVPHGDRGVAVGSTSEEDWEHPSETDAQLDARIEAARTLLPALEGAKVMERWAGIRPRARLPDPAIGALEPRLWLATGGYKIGLGIGHEVGRALAALICGERQALPQSFLLDHQLDLLR